MVIAPQSVSIDTRNMNIFVSAARNHKVSSLAHPWINLIIADNLQLVFVANMNRASLGNQVDQCVSWTVSLPRCMWIFLFCRSNGAFGVD